MNKEYRYRKHIYWGQYLIIVLFAFLFLMMLSFSISIIRTSGVPKIGALPATLAFIFLVEGVVIWYLFYRLAGTAVSVNDDVLIYKTRTGEKRIPLESIYLEFAAIKYTGGWLKIKDGKETIRLTVVLEDISGFLQELKTKMDNKQLTSHYDSHKLFGFLKTAAASDQSWERAYPIYGKIFLLISNLSFAIFIGFIFATFSFYGFMLALLWCIISMFWIIAAYVIAEIILFREIAKKSNESNFTVPPRDLNYEKLVFNRAFTWASLAYFVFSLFVLVVAVWIKFSF